MNVLSKIETTMKKIASLTILGVLLSGAAFAQYITNVFTPDADTYVRNQPGTENSNYGTLGYIYLYSYTGARDYYGYVRFDLSSLPAGLPIADASLTFTKVSTSERNDGLTTARFRVLGLLDVPGNTPQNWGELTLTWNNKGAEYVSENTYDASRTVDFDGTAGNEFTDGTIARISGANLVNFLSSRLSASENRGLVTFIVDFASLESGRGYGLGTKENSNPDAVPKLMIAIIPEPGSVALAVVSVVALAIVARRRK